DEERAQAAGLPPRRAGPLVRVHAVDGHGQRPRHVVLPLPRSGYEGLAPVGRPAGGTPPELGNPGSQPKGNAYAASPGLSCSSSVRSTCRPKSASVKSLFVATATGRERLPSPST